MAEAQKDKAMQDGSINDSQDSHTCATLQDENKEGVTKQKYAESTPISFIPDTLSKKCDHDAMRGDDMKADEQRGAKAQRIESQHCTSFDTVSTTPKLTSKSFDNEIGLVGSDDGGTARNPDVDQTLPASIPMKRSAAVRMVLAMTLMMLGKWQQRHDF